MASRRILVLGSTHSVPTITSYSWNYIPPSLNVADYDTLILNFAPFEIPTIASSINIDTIPSFQQFARLLFSPNSEIIVIGRPFFKLPYRNRFGGNQYLEPT